MARSSGITPTLPIFDFSEAVMSFSQSSSEERGAVFTRREVVEFILDLVGYTSDKPLSSFRILEPSFGHGDFLLPVVERLLKSYRLNFRGNHNFAADLSKSIRAVEINRSSIQSACTQLMEMLLSYDLTKSDAERVLDAWIVEGDFLLTDLPHTFTHVVGNPPYVRQELIPNVLLTEYRARYRTIYDRADLYIPFIEKCLTNLDPGGTLGFICSDRWMKNKYGGPLREMVAKNYRLMTYIDMVDTPAFNSEVSAYPAITIIKREKPGPTRIAHRPQIKHDHLNILAAAINSEAIPEGSGVIEISEITKDSEPWILQSFDQLSLVRRLEKDFPCLEKAGCKVGIGVATGADKIFIGPFKDLDVEPDRKLPLVTTKDIETGTVDWKGLGVINPFTDNGTLVNLTDYPKLARYFEEHADAIRKRNCAKGNPRAWYRTIDRIYPELTNRPKLLIPDIKGDAHIVYEGGHLYPHHNLYYITSDEWDLRALQSILQSGIAKLFISIYSTQMRGGYLRFQAQYLRRIRVPLWKDVPSALRKALKNTSKSSDIEICNQAVFDLYQLTDEERGVIQNKADR